MVRPKSIDFGWTEDGSAVQLRFDFEGNSIPFEFSRQAYASFVGDALRVLLSVEGLSGESSKREVLKPAPELVRSVQLFHYQGGHLLAVMKMDGSVQQLYLSGKQYDELTTLLTENKYPISHPGPAAEKRAYPTCYMCDSPRTTREHVPAKAIFPESKDIGKHLRKDLKRVPSCNAHNTEKSHDDELLMRVLAHGPVNDVGKQQAQTKILRSLENDPKAREDMQRESRPVYFLKPDGQWYRSATVQFPRKRVEVILEWMGRALYFLHYQERWLGDVIVMPSFFSFAAREMRKLHSMSDPLLMNAPKHGANPSVFYYQVMKGIAASGAAFNSIRATFYEKTLVSFLFAESRTPAPPPSDSELEPL
jgi:hypothetical protein